MVPLQSAPKFVFHEIKQVLDFVLNLLFSPLTTCIVDQFRQAPMNISGIFVLLLIDFY